LAERLGADGHRIFAELRPRRDAPPASLALVETLEDLLYRRGRPAPSDPIEDANWPAPEAGEAGLVFDLTGSAEPQAGAIAPLYDGGAGDAARDAILLTGRAPELALALTQADGWRVLASGLPAIERPSILQFGRDALANRIVTLARRVAARPPPGAQSALRGPAPAASSPLAFFASSLAAAARRRLRKLVAREGHWRIGLRALDPGESASERLDEDIWSWTPDDRRRYFADPFLLEEKGETYLFCEEYPFATQKGVISVLPLDAAGVPGPARVVLERPYHLSYPLLFRRDGQIYMMPESSGNRTLEIYRADPFPYRWTLDRVVLSGVELSDATPFEWGGQWWLSAASSEPETSTWDCLSLFSGPGPLGPWTAAGEGPALLDASAARPAGNLFRRGGELWRPAQDCTSGYGGGLALCRVDAVEPGALNQTVMRRYAPAAGMHTFNATDRFATIDRVGRRARSARLDGLASL
jgi:hypothetical protein